MEPRNRMVIAGIDINPGHSPSSRRQPHYALVILVDGSISEKYEDVSLSRMIRLIWEHRPSIIATDNILELARNTSQLAHILSLLPSETRIVQVTGWGPEAVNVRSIARRYGLNIQGKLTPIKTAWIAAVIASKGGGYEVRLAEDKTRIVISKGRTVSHGGMSYDRYRRSIHASILAATREVKRKLDREGLDYDLTFRKGAGGLERSVFTVYAPRSRLNGIVKPFRNKNVRLTIQPVYKNKLIVPVKNSNDRGLILGVDPGIYTGIAIMDLNGRPLFLYSSKNLDRNEIIGMVRSMGSVIVVSTDVAHPPDLVKKISASLNAQLYVPQRDLSTDEKRTIISTLEEKYPDLTVEDTHERDALAAAYKAYQSMADKLRQVEAYVENMDLDINTEKVKMMVMRGASIAEAVEKEIEKILPREKYVEQNTRNDETNTSDVMKEKVAELREKIRWLVAEKLRLTRELEEAERRIEELELEIKAMAQSNDGCKKYERKMETVTITLKHSEERIRALEERNKQLAEKLKRMEEIIRLLASGKHIIIERYPVMSSIPLNHVKSLRDGIIYIDNPSIIDNSVLDQLKANRVAIASSRLPRNFVEEYRIAAISINPENTILIDNYAVLSANLVDEAKREWEKVEEMNRMDEYTRVLKLLEEYKRKRRKIFGENYDDY